MTRTLYVCLAFVVAALSSPTAYGFCLDTASGTQPKVYWPTMPVTFKIHDTGSATGPLAASQPAKADEFTAIRAAFAAWAAAPCTNLQFTDGGLLDSTEPVNYQHTALEIRVFWARNTTEWGDTNTTLIAKTWVNQDATGKIFAAGILLNAIDKVWSTTGEANKYDLLSITLKEVGRVLGLASSTDSAAIMGALPPAGDTSKRTLTSDDTDGLAYLYPQNGTCGQTQPNAACGTQQQDAGIPQEDGGSTQEDGGNAQHDGGGTGDGGVQTCQLDSDCPSNVCKSDHTCLPVKDDSGCSCTVGTLGRGGYLGLSLLCLGLALGLGLRCRRR